MELTLELVDFSKHITEERNILLQGTKDLTIATAYATAPLQTATNLKLGFNHCIPLKLKIQADIIFDQSYTFSWTTWYRQRWNPVLEVTVNTGLGVANAINADLFSASAAILDARAGTGRIDNLLFSEPESNNAWNESNPTAPIPLPVSRTVRNPVEIEVELPNVISIKSAFVGFRLLVSGTETGTPNTALINSSSNRVQLRLYSVSLEARPVGCDGVQVISLDKRLRSTSGNDVIEYPMLFLGRQPVKEDAKGWKEVLVFQDRATTLRVLPQPILLNEDNNYATAATVESNGSWTLYDYDMQKLSARLESGQPITGGMGNDILRLIKNPLFGIYGFYDMALLFATDTTDEPYVVPVELDYAVPLAVAGTYLDENGDPKETPEGVGTPQTRIITIKFDDNTRCANLHIFRDRAWRMVGFPSEYLTIEREFNDRNDTVRLCVRPDYNVLGLRAYTWTVQSGSKRVIINVEINIISSFSVQRLNVAAPSVGAYTPFVILERTNSLTPFTQHVIVKRRGFGEPRALTPLEIAGADGTDYNTGAVRGYTWNGQLSSGIGDHTVKILQSIANKNQAELLIPGWVDEGEPADSIYELIEIKYTGLTYDAGLVTNPAGAFQQDQGLTFTTVVDTNRKANVTLYRNIDLNYMVTGQDNRPAPDGTAVSWTISKTVAQTLPQYSNQAVTWKYQISDDELPGYPKITDSSPLGGNRFAVKGNLQFAMATVGSVSTSASPGTSTANAIAGANVSIGATGTRLRNLNNEITLTFGTNVSGNVGGIWVSGPGYTQYYENTPTTATTRPVFTEPMALNVEVRHPHYFKVSDTKLQWDNNWVQHHWAITNPDAEIVDVGSVPLTGGNALTVTRIPQTTDALWKFETPSSTGTEVDVYRMDVESHVPASLLTDMWLSSPTRVIAKSFRIGVCYLEHTRNEIVPLMVGATIMRDAADRDVSSVDINGVGFKVYDSWDSNPDVVPQVFNRNNQALNFNNGKNSVKATFTSSRGKLRSAAEFNDRNKTFSFIVEFDQHYIIRSWSYTVQGRKNIACGFLIEGQMEGFHASGEWGLMSASSDFSTRDLDSRDTTTTIDYLTVNPRPWKRLRITVAQVRDDTGDKNPDQLTSGEFRIGQFQFYSGYPMLGRAASTTVAGNVEVFQLNTANVQARLIPASTTRRVGVVSDGLLPEAVNLTSGGTPDMGVGDVGGYFADPLTHWNYTLVDSTGSAPTSFGAQFAHFGILLEGDNVQTPTIARIIGVRYDTGMVDGHSQAGALVLGISDAIRKEAADLLTPANFTQKLVISAWRYLGLAITPLTGVDTLALDNAARIKLEDCAVSLSDTIYDYHPPQVLVKGTTLLRVNTDNHDYRLVRYEGNTVDLSVSASNLSDWKNIGQDIVLDVKGSDPSHSLDDSPTMLSNPSRLTAIANHWRRGGNLSNPEREEFGGASFTKIAFTNPIDMHRLFYDGANWSDLGEYSFTDHRGNQYYRNLDEEGVRSFRIHVPGLADSFHYNNGGFNMLRVLVGDLQLFEQYRNSGTNPGADVTFKDIKVTVNGVAQSIQYGDIVYVPTSDFQTTVNVRCIDLRVHGAAYTSGYPIYAMARSGAPSSSSWVVMTSSGMNVNLEQNHTATTVTLFYRAGNSPGVANPALNARHIPFFTFLVLRET